MQVNVQVDRVVVHDLEESAMGVDALRASLSKRLQNAIAVQSLGAGVMLSPIDTARNRPRHGSLCEKLAAAILAKCRTSIGEFDTQEAGRTS
jgi:hypothetical protein